MAKNAKNPLYAFNPKSILSFKWGNTNYAGRFLGECDRFITLTGVVSGSDDSCVLSMKFPKSEITEITNITPNSNVAGLHTQTIRLVPTAPISYKPKYPAPVKHECAECVRRARRKAKSKAKDFYTSQKWLELRFAALSILANKCALCGNSPTNGAILHVDHIKPKSKYPELAYDLNNLQILCKHCNLGKSDS